MVREVRLDWFSVAGEKITLAKDSIVCVVGPNSCGKSSLLSSIFGRVVGQKNLERPCALEELKLYHEIDDLGAQQFFQESCSLTENSQLQWYGGQISAPSDPAEWIHNWAKKKAKYDGLYSAFVTRIPAQNRLNSSRATNHQNTMNLAPTHPFHVLYRYPTREKKLSECCEKLFGHHLLLDPGLGRQLALRVGEYDGEFANRSMEFSNEIRKLPLIDHEGDGVQAAVGLLADMISFQHSTVLVDEPDLYLHPPQAYRLSKMFVDLMQDRQLIVATHSSRFVQGLVEAASDRLILVRLERQGNATIAKTVDNNIFKEISSDPVLQFTDVVGGLFYKHIAFCEDPTDCMLYKWALSGNDNPRDIDEVLWIGTSSKYNFKKFARVSKALGQNPLMIADFDVISPTSDSHLKVLLSLVELLGGDVANVEARIANIHSIVENNSKLSWEQLKANGLESLKPYADIYNKVLALFEDLKSIGILVIQEGELESLCAPRLELSKGIETVNGMMHMNLNCDQLKPLRRLADEVRTTLGIWTHNTDLIS